MKIFFKRLFATKEGIRILLFIAIVFIGGYSGASRINNQVSIDEIVSFLQGLSTQDETSNLGQSELLSVKRVIDGDTIELENGDKVRYIGVDTPETVKPNSPVDCFGKEASAANKNMVEGKKIRMEKDVSDRDRYGRLLRFVYLEDGTFVNDWMVRNGYAFASTFPPDVKRADEFKLAEREARENNRGLWASDTCNGRK